MISIHLVRIVLKCIDGTYLNIERAFFTALRAGIYTRRLRSIFKFFSTKCALAMDAHMDMDKGIVGFTKVDGHCFGSLFALRNREIGLVVNRYKPFISIQL